MVGSNGAKKRETGRGWYWLLFVPFLYIFLSIGKSAPPVMMRIAYSALYAVVFIPMFFFIDRIAYRAYQRRLRQP